MGSIATAHCSEPTLHKHLTKPDPPIEPPISERPAVVGGSRVPRAAFGHGQSGARSAVTQPEDTGAVPSRDEVLAKCAAASSSSRETLETLWTCAAASLDEYLARLLGLGRNLEEPEVQACNLALGARDCATLICHLRALVAREGGEAPSVCADAEQLSAAEERHVVICALEDAIRRADVDDMELWLDEAVHQGIPVGLQRRYCEEMRSALNVLFEEGGQTSGGLETCAGDGDASAGSPLAEGGAADDASAAAFATWSSAGAESETRAGESSAASGGGVGDFETWSSAFSEPFPDAFEIGGEADPEGIGADDGGGVAGDDAGAAERDMLWAQLEQALACNDEPLALEAIAMLESVGELDAETAAEARSAASEQDRCRAPRERSQPATPAAPEPSSSSSPQRRRHSSVPEQRRPRWDSDSPSQPSASPSSPRRASERRSGDVPASGERGESARRPAGRRGTELPTSPARATASSERHSTGGDRARGPGAGWAAHMAAVQAATDRHSVQADTAFTAWESPPAEPKTSQSRLRHVGPERPFSASTSAPATSSAGAAAGQSAGSRGRLFKEALWKRKINMQTMTRLRGGAPSSSSDAAAAPLISPRVSREQARSRYSAGVRNSVHADGLAGESGGRAGASSPRGATPGGARGAGISSPRGTRQRQGSAGARDADAKPSEENTGRARERPAPPAASSAIPPMKAGAVGAEAPQRTPQAPPEPASAPSKAPSRQKATPQPPPEPAKAPSRAGGGFFFSRQSANTKDTPSKKQPPQSKPTPTPKTAGPPPAPPPPPPPPQQGPKASAAAGAKPSSAPKAKSTANAFSGGPGSTAGPSFSSAPRFKSAADAKASASGSAGGPAPSSAPKPKPAAAPPPRSRPPPGDTASPMQLLELKSGFTDEDLRAAYKRAAMKWHPDRPAWRAAGEAEQKHATEMFQKCKDAYDILSGKASRVR